ncbi:MAG TPA: hypothetical protein DCL77_14535 [Prolixibacteraceae bacterium]|jgi:hypothetical protein|nr:hypothetical protein [Prolixibacteraceae bacterium]
MKQEIFNSAELELAGCIAMLRANRLAIDDSDNFSIQRYPWLPDPEPRIFDFELLCNAFALHKLN